MAGEWRLLTPHHLPAHHRLFTPLLRCYRKLLMMLSNAATITLLLICCYAGWSTAFIISPQQRVFTNSAAYKSQPAYSSSHDNVHDVTSTCLDMVSSRRNFLDETMASAALSITAAVTTNVVAGCIVYFQGFALMGTILRCKALELEWEMMNFLLTTNQMI